MRRCPVLAAVLLSHYAHAVTLDVARLRDRTYKLRFPAGAGYGKVG